MNRLHLILLSATLALCGLGLFLYKAIFLDFPLVPGQLIPVWTVEAQVTFRASNRPVKVELLIPTSNSHYQTLNEKFISRDYGFHLERQDGNRKAVWAVRKASGRQNLFYSTTVKMVEPEDDKVKNTPPLTLPPWEGPKHVAAESILAASKEHSTDFETLIIEILQAITRPAEQDKASRQLLGKNPTLWEQAQVAAGILNMATLPARTVHGLALEDQRQKAPLIHWVEVFYDGRWHPFNVAAAGKGVPEYYFAWWRGNQTIISSFGTKSLDVNFSLAAGRMGALETAVESGHKIHPFFEKFSLFGLPLTTQAVYRILLVVPIGALILVLLRNVVGLRTFGTFMPILIALAFRETQLLWGVILFSLLVVMGLAVRLYLERLKLLVVPRLAAMLSVVIILMVNFSMVTHHLEMQMGLSVALFPMVIMTMAIERMSIIWDESGPYEAFRQGVGTLMVSSVVYLVMNQPTIDHLVFVFPELLLPILAVTLLLGRYTGYRLTELARFRALSGGESDDVDR